MNDYSPDIHNHHKHPHHNQQNRHRAPHIPNCLVPIQRPRNRKRSSRKRRIRKHKRIPRHRKIHPASTRTTPMRANADEEEPQRKAPQPKAHEIRHDHAYAAGQLAVAGAHEVARHDFRQLLAHGHDARDGEAAGSHGDEHTGPQGLFREFLRHQPVDESGVDHEADEEADALDDVAAEDDLERDFGVGDFGRERACVRADDEEGVCCCLLASRP